jgi:hypothetical protein
LRRAVGREQGEREEKRKLPCGTSEIDHEANIGSQVLKG